MPTYKSFLDKENNNYIRQVGMYIVVTYPLRKERTMITRNIDGVELKGFKETLKQSHPAWVNFAIVGTDHKGEHYIDEDCSVADGLREKEIQILIAELEKAYAILVESPELTPELLDFLSIQ